MLGNFVFLSGILALFLCMWSYWRDFQYEKQHWGTCKSKDSRDRTPPQRSLQFPYSKTELFLAANEEIFTILNNQMVKN